jgi:hypothetical protein
VSIDIFCGLDLDQGIESILIEQAQLLRQYGAAKEIKSSILPSFALV